MSAYVTFRRGYVTLDNINSRDRAWLWRLSTKYGDHEGYVSTYKKREALTDSQAKRLASEAFRRFPAAQFVNVFPSAWGERLRFDRPEKTRASRSKR